MEQRQAGISDAMIETLSGALHLASPGFMMSGAAIGD
jgi:hypothetical protein